MHVGSADRDAKGFHLAVIGDAKRPAGIGIGDSELDEPVLENICLALDACKGPVLIVDHEVVAKPG